MNPASLMAIMQVISGMASRPRPQIPGPGGMVVGWPVTGQSRQSAPDNEAQMMQAILGAMQGGGGMSPGIMSPMGGMSGVPPMPQQMPPQMGMGGMMGGGMGGAAGAGGGLGALMAMLGGGGQ